MATTSINFDGALVFPDGTRQLSTYGHLKNRILNGKMQIDQLHGGQVQMPAPAYSSNMCMFTIDRWIFSSIGVATYAANVNQVIIGSGQHAKTALQFSANTAAVAGYDSNYSGFAQRIESIYTEDLVGSAITISANISISTGATVYWSLYSPNTKDGYTQGPVDWYNDLVLGHPGTPSQSNPVYYNCTLLSSSSFTATTTPTTYRITTGKMTDAVKNGLMVYFYIQTGALYQRSFTITDVVLEKGPTGPPAGWSGGNYSSLPSPIDNRSVKEELNLCRRYLYCEGSSVPITPNNNKAITLGFHDASYSQVDNMVNLRWNFKVPMYGGVNSTYRRMVYMAHPWYVGYPPGKIVVRFDVGASGYYIADGSGTLDRTNSGYLNFTLESPNQNSFYQTGWIYTSAGITKSITGVRTRINLSGALASGTFASLNLPYATPSIRYMVGVMPSGATRNAIGFRSEL
jgi:hypothetical protein